MTDTELEKKQKESLGALWMAYGFNKSEIAKDLGYQPSVVSNWFKRGRISATAALKAEQTEKSKLAGITKEMLRPDVKEWFGL